MLYMVTKIIDNGGTVDAPFMDEQLARGFFDACKIEGPVTTILLKLGDTLINAKRKEGDSYVRLHTRTKAGYCKTDIIYKSLELVPTGGLFRSLQSIQQSSEYEAGAITVGGVVQEPYYFNRSDNPFLQIDGWSKKAKNYQVETESSTFDDSKTITYYETYEQARTAFNAAKEDLHISFAQLWHREEVVDFYSIEKDTAFRMHLRMADDKEDTFLIKSGDDDDSLRRVFREYADNKSITACAVTYGNQIYDGLIKNHSGTDFLKQPPTDKKYKIEQTWSDGSQTTIYSNEQDARVVQLEKKCTGTLITDLSTGLCWRTVHLEPEGIEVVESEIQVEEDWSDNEDYDPSFILEVINKKGSVIISLPFQSTQEIKEVLDTIRVVKGARIIVTST